MDVIARIAPLLVLGAWIWVVSSADAAVNALFAVALLVAAFGYEWDSAKVKQRQRADR